MVMFEKIELFHCDVKGRGLRATDLIPPGEEVLTEKPLAYALENAKYRGSRCDYCFKDPEKLLCCSRCKFTAYCNQKCQANDWHIHKQECKCLMKVAPRQPPDIVRLVSQILFKSNAKNDSVSGEYRSIIGKLTANKDSTTNARKEAFFAFGAVLHEYLQGTNIPFEDMDVLGLFCRISCNSFSITNAELNSVGTGIYKTAALINHSCDPNCVAIFDGPDIFIRSIKEIKPGEEILLTYVSIISSLEVRQSELMEGYMFECTCHVCTGQKFNDFQMKSFKCESCPCKVHVLALAENTSQIDEFSIKSCACNTVCKVSTGQLEKVNCCMDELEALYNTVKVIPTDEEQRKLKECLKTSEKVLGDTNISLVRCYERAMDGCLEQGDWKGALAYGKKLEKPYQLYHSRFHPTIGLHYFKLGKLEILLDNLRGGISYLQKAMKVLSISHGKQHELVKSLQQSITDTCNDLAACERFESYERIHKEMEEGY